MSSSHQFAIMSLHAGQKNYHEVCTNYLLHSAISSTDSAKGSYSQFHYIARKYVFVHSTMGRKEINEPHNVLSMAIYLLSLSQFRWPFYLILVSFLGSWKARITVQLLIFSHCVTSCYGSFIIMKCDIEKDKIYKVGQQTLPHLRSWIITCV